MKGSESYTYKDYRGGIPPRAFGSETEYTHSGYIENMYAGYGYYGSSIVPLTEHINPDYLVSSGRDQYISAVVSTGGELYVDAEALEYATPECRTPRELALHERAGERITRDTVLRIAAYDDIDKMQLYKRSGYANVPNPTRPETYFLKEDSIGNHENYTSINMFSGRAISKYNDTHAAKSLASYLALRKLIDGIGMVDENHYSITQRPRAIDYCDLTPAGQKHGKKRAFAQHEDRLEIRTGEANKSDWATEFKFGLTSLVIRLVEHEAFPERLQLLDPNQAVSDLARDPLAAVLTKNGIYQKGVDVLREMVDTAVDLCQSSADWPAYEQQAARDFYKFYDDLHMVSLSDDDVTALADRIDWAGRYKYLVSRGGTYATITTRDLSMVRDDLKWDEINDREISRRYFSRFGHTALQAIIPTAPNTRAKTRIEIAKQLREDDKLSTVEWRAIHGKQGAGVYQFDGPLSQKVTYHPYQRTFNQNNE